MTGRSASPAPYQSKPVRAAGLGGGRLSMVGCICCRAPLCRYWRSGTFCAVTYEQRTTKAAQRVFRIGASVRPYDSVRAAGPVEKTAPQSSFDFLSLSGGGNHCAWSQQLLGTEDFPSGWDLPGNFTGAIQFAILRALRRGKKQREERRERGKRGETPLSGGRTPKNNHRKTPTEQD